MTALEEMVEKDSIFQTIDLFIDQLSIRSIGVKSNDELDYRKLGSFYLSLATYPNTIIDAKVFVEKYKTQVLTPDQVEIIMSETLKIQLITSDVDVRSDIAKSAPYSKIVSCHKKD